MKRPNFRLALAAGVILPLGLACAALAQDAPTQPPAAGPAPHEHHVDPAQRRAHMAERLRAELQLSPGQDAALNAYVEALRPPEGMKEHREHAPGEMGNLTTPQRLDRMLARFDEMRTRMVARIEATKQFYAQLSPAQQHAFDALGPMGGRFGGHHGDMDGRRGDGDHGGWGRHGDGEHPMAPDGQPS